MQQQQNPAAAAEEGEDQAANDGDASGAEDTKDKGKEQEKGEGKDKDKEGKKKPPLPVVTAVLKVDMHCDGCAKRIRGSVRRYPGKFPRRKAPPLSLITAGLNWLHACAKAERQLTDRSIRRCAGCSLIDPQVWRAWRWMWAGPP